MDEEKQQEEKKKKKEERNPSQTRSWWTWNLIYTVTQAHLLRFHKLAGSVGIRTHDFHEYDEMRSEYQKSLSCGC